MSPFSKVFILFAIACPLTSLADCSSSTVGSCMEQEHDETSLVQLKQTLKHRSEKGRDDDVVDPVVDPGSDWKAFEANKAKSQSRIDAAAAHRRAFEQEVEQERAHSRKETENRIAMDRKRLEAEDKVDHDVLESATSRHRAVEKDALDKVERAKREWEATAIKKGHVENAAVAGRIAGVNAGAMDAHEKAVAAEEAAAEAARARRHAEVLAAEAKKAKEDEDAVNKATRRKDAENEAIGDRAKKNTDAAVKHADDETDEIVHHITSVDPAIEKVGDEHENIYQKATAKAQKRIDHAVSAEWPH